MKRTGEELLSALPSPFFCIRLRVSGSRLLVSELSSSRKGSVWGHPVTEKSGSSSGTVFLDSAAGNRLFVLSPLLSSL